MAEINPEFANNPDPRCACVLLLDTSGSMSGPRIDALNKGLEAFQKDIQGDPLASRRVEVGIVTFGKGGFQILQDFTVASQFSAPVLEPGGNTPMGEAINLALDMVQTRKNTYRSNGIPYYQPWVFLITDGAPNSDSPWEQAASRVQADMEKKALTFFAVGVEDADTDVLSKITTRVHKINSLEFRELFLWLSQSQRRVSNQKVGEQTPLPPIGFGSPV